LLLFQQAGSLSVYYCLGSATELALIENPRAVKCSTIKFFAVSIEGIVERSQPSE